MNDIPEWTWQSNYTFITESNFPLIFLHYTFSCVSTNTVTQGSDSIVSKTRFGYETEC